MVFLCNIRKSDIYIRLDFQSSICLFVLLKVKFGGVDYALAETMESEPHPNLGEFYGGMMGFIGGGYLNYVSGYPAFSSK